jgi:hypothetical protein
MFLGLSFTLSVQVVRCIVTLYRLTVLDEPAWDHAAVQRAVDLLLVLDRLAAMLDVVSREAGEVEPDDLYVRLARLVRLFHARCAAKIAPEGGSGEKPLWAGGGVGRGGGGGGVDPSQVLMQDVDFGDDKWLEDFISGFK